MSDLNAQAGGSVPLGVGDPRIRRAQLAVADHSTDAADCLLLLDILGLLPEPPESMEEQS